ncbi:hypothetical protein HGRIS_010179 [Hohenbuehelia grisea]|uniref:Serine/threonine-protein phosphatase 4 regulatory subunit 3-like central domain-containing protein n=1 Tax=Hohenbuehelia grisea TaxID=104357 RepID=A0ABR3J435_9AGAR
MPGDDDDPRPEQQPSQTPSPHPVDVNAHDSQAAPRDPESHASPPRQIVIEDAHKDAPSEALLPLEHAVENTERPVGSMQTEEQAAGSQDALEQEHYTAEMLEDGGIGSINGLQQVELVEHTPDGAGGLGDVSVGDDPHDWFPDNDHELKRVKVYELVGTRWVDQGTAFCFGQFQDETNEALLIARSETSYSEIILSTTIRSNDVYQRQQDTLIVWTEPDGTDYALSFQDPEGCSEVWNFILEVQRHLNSGDPLESSSPQIGPHESSIGPIIRHGQLPPPQLGIISEIERAIKHIVRAQNVKDRICEYMIKEEYIKQMVDVMHQAEDLENIENLHALCTLMQTILLLNDHSMYEHILDDSLFFGVVGMLEYDPEFPHHKANYREFLSTTTQFHQPIAIPDPAVQRKIHHTYRLQFLKDVVLARVLDDSTFNVLSSCIIFNQIDIITHVQSDHRFLREVVGLYVDEDMLSGGGARRVPPPQVAQGLVVVRLENGNDDSGAASRKENESATAEPKNANGEIMEIDSKPAPNGAPTVNGHPARGGIARSASYAFAPPEELSEEELALRREVIFLIQQLCVMAKNVQLPARMALFRTLVDRGVLFAVQWALALPERAAENKLIISAGGEVLAALLDHDLIGVRGHVIKQLSAIEKEREAGKRGADKAETILAMACRVLVQSRDLAVQSQVGDALKVWLDVPPNDAADAAHVRSLQARAKDDPGTERFLDYFYGGGCVHALVRPINELPEWRDHKEPFLSLTREQTNLYVYLCDLLCNFALQHSFRSHFFIMTSNIVVRLCTLFKARDKHLQHASFRIFRLLLRQNNRNMLTHLAKHDVFKPILDLTLAESRRDNLLSSSCHEFFEIMRKENMKEPIEYCMKTHEPLIRKLASTPLGHQRFEQFIRRWEMNNEPPPVDEPKPTKPDTRPWPGQGRGIDAEEEDYFHADDEDDLLLTPPSIASQQRALKAAPSLPLNTLKRKRRPGISAAPKTLRTTPSLTPPPSPLQGLQEYEDEDDEENGILPVSPESEAAVKAQMLAVQKKSPLGSTIALPPSPKLMHRQIPSQASSSSAGPSGPPLRRLVEDDDEEDNMLEALMSQRSRPTTPTPTLDSMRPGEKRRREDDDDSLFERLSKAKKPDASTQRDGVSPFAGRLNPGDDPPKKIKLKFGAASLSVASGGAASSPSSVSGASSSPPSEPGTKDGDTG